MDFTQVCRICLQINKDSIPLFSDNYQCIEILQKLNLCFQVLLCNESYLPNKICTECLEELEVANNFRIKCITFEDRFKLFNNQKINTGGKPTHTKLDYQDCDSTGLRSTLDNECENEYQEVNEENVLKNTTNHRDVTHKCELCGKSLKTKQSLAKHIVSMHQKRKHVGQVTGSGINRQYHCTKCLYKTPHSQTLVNHMRRHSGERPFHCNCGKSFSQSSSLSAHQKTHSDETQFTCATCGKQFKHAFSLKKHLRVHESGSFACDVCQKSLKSQQSLQEHMQRHYRIHNFSCEDCGATFVSSSELINHKKTHGMERKAVCHLCEYKTRAKKNLMVHLKRHVGEKLFKCNLCNLAFYTSSDLKRHQRVHNRQKLFPCPTCAQRFSHSPSLNKHMRNVHGTHYKWADLKSLQMKKAILKDETAK